MSLSEEQLKHDRINLRRLVKSLDIVLSDDDWAEGNEQNRQDAWVKAQGMAQKIRYARQLLLNVEYYEGLDPQSPSPPALQYKYMQTMRETLDRLDDTVSVIQQRLEPEPAVQTSYLSLIPLPAAEEEVTVLKPSVTILSHEAELIPSESPPSERHRSVVDSVLDPPLHLFASSSTPHLPDPGQAPLSSRLPPTSSFLSASLQTQEELSDELARMAAQLKRNAQYFSESLDKDKSLVQSAAEVLEKNYDSMTKERVRLREHRGKSFGTTWMVFGALFAVSIAWVFMFFIIRFT